MGFSNLNHLTRTLLLVVLLNVFLSCWNEQKYPDTRVQVVFITPTKKRTVMCLCGVTRRSGHVDRTHRSVHHELQWLSVDRTLDNVRSALTGRVLSRFPFTGPLLMSTGRWTSSVRSLAEQCPVSIDRVRPIKILPLWDLTGVDWMLAPSVRSRKTISPRSNELTGLCASVRSHRNQRPVSI